MLASFYQEENHQSNIELSCYTAVSADIQGSFCIKLPEEYHPIYERSQVRENKLEVNWNCCDSSYSYKMKLSVSFNYSIGKTKASFNPCRAII